MRPREWLMHSSLSAQPIDDRRRRPHGGLSGRGQHRLPQVQQQMDFRRRRGGDPADRARDRASRVQDHRQARAVAAAGEPRFAVGVGGGRAAAWAGGEQWVCFAQHGRRFFESLPKVPLCPQGPKSDAGWLKMSPVVMVEVRTFPEGRLLRGATAPGDGTRGDSVLG
jgi:hypothetical protein